MNIAFVADTGYSYISGAARSTQRFCDLLATRGHTIAVLTSRRKNQQKIEYVSGVLVKRFLGVPLPSSSKEAYIALPFFYPVFQFLKKSRVEVLHVTEPTFLGFSSIVAAKVLNIPVVVTSHIQSENVAYNTSLNKTWIQWIFNRYLVLFYRDADMVIFPSKFAQSILLKRGLHTPSVVISNGVDTSKFFPGDKQRSKKLLHLENSSVLLTVSRLMVEKNIEVIIKSLPTVIRKIPNVKLVIIGDGSQKQKLQRLVKSLDIQKYVIFTGLVSDDVLHSYYHAADAYVSASLVELEGMSVLEAMASGLPVAVADSKTSAAPILVQRGGYTFPPRSAIALSEIIIKIVSQPAVAENFGKCGRNIAMQYNIQSSLKKLEAVYREARKKNVSFASKIINNFSDIVHGRKI